MTEAIRRTAENFSDGEFEVTCKPTPGAPKFIETYEDEIKTAPGMIQLVRENEDKFDAFIIACHDDPNLDVMKEITRKPVVGIAEASMKIASMLGHRFSVLTTSEHSIPIKEALARKYHLQDVLVSVRAPGKETIEKSDELKYMETAQSSIKEDMAEVLVLGCAGMTGLDKRLEEKLGIPVLDGIVCALIIASGLVKYKVSTSKIRRYNPEY
jgi:allantoin racemase